MATKKKNYWYVLVLTNGGPKFVTSVDYSTKYARWDKNEKPKELEKFWAQDLALGLNLNLTTAFAVCQPFEIDTQPYRYSKGHFEWKWEEKEEQDNDESK